MKKIFNISLLLAAFTTYAANPEPVLYGTLTDDNGKTFTGTIRWGDQETFLSDIFNGRKIKTVGIEHLSDDEVDHLESLQPGPKASIGDVEITFKSFFGNDIELPYFNTTFGSIKRIDVKDGLFTATLHDGTTIISDGEGSNDLHDDINVMDAQGKRNEFDIEDISSVVFSKAPSDVTTYGDGIYGTVTSEIGTFSGRIMWDKDERLTHEKLDGNDETKDYEIQFADIKSIEKSDNKSKVNLKDGVELLLGGTNDVNRGNRGIWVDNPDLGRIEIHWKQFIKLDIEEVDVEWLDFDDYVQQAAKLSGTVILNDDTQLEAQQITLDLNQQSQDELLYADVNQANRQIPFRIIKQITKKHEHAVDLLMRDQSTLMAYGTRSVNIENNGVLISNNDEHRWVPWQQVKSIIFK